TADETAEIMELRRESLIDNCAKYSLCSIPLEPDLNTKLITVRKYNMMYCDIAKVASTNWKKVVLMMNKYVKTWKDLESLSHAASVHDLAAAYKLRYEPDLSLMERTKNYTTFLAVRHPMERLVSAYEDKFLPTNRSPVPEMWQLGDEIIKTFPGNLSAKYPTFEQFLRYLLKTNDKNPHWDSYVDLCHPCNMHYDVIIHLDSISEDSRYLFSVVNAPPSISFPKSTKKNRNTVMNVQSHVSQTDATVIKKIEDRYNLDYKLFEFEKL
uniref:Carbohydrate sulfotransferase n=1 Tax=Ciona savignyi TaxID=51511 RepID=H2ZMM4_CIOSA